MRTHTSSSKQQQEGNRIEIDITDFTSLIEELEVTIELRTNTTIEFVGKQASRNMVSSSIPGVRIRDSMTSGMIEVGKGNYHLVNKSLQLTGNAIMTFDFDATSERKFDTFINLSPSPSGCANWQATLVVCNCGNSACSSTRTVLKRCLLYSCLVPRSYTLSHVSNDEILSEASIVVLGVHIGTLLCVFMCILISKRKQIKAADNIQRIINNLPVVANPAPEVVCSICLESVPEDEDDPQSSVTDAWVSLECSHVFHRQCIMTWLLRADPPSCPVCRDPVLAVASTSENAPDNG